MQKKASSTWSMNQHPRVQSWLHQLIVFIFPFTAHFLFHCISSVTPVFLYFNQIIFFLNHSSNSNLWIKNYRRQVTKFCFLGCWWCSCILHLKYFILFFLFGINSASVNIILSANSTVLAEYECLFLAILLFSFAFYCSEILPVWWWFWQGLFLSVLQQDAEVRLAVRILQE